MARPPDKFSERVLRERLTESHGDFIITTVFMSSSEIARWLGQHLATVRRWRREAIFPAHDSVIPIPRMKGKGEGYAWRPSTVIEWLRKTGRLLP